MPKPRKLRSSADPLQKGERYGDLKVLGFLGRRRYPCGQTKLMVACRCLGCGEETVATTAHLRSGAIKRCKKCADRKRAEKKSRKLPLSGKTITQIAEETGIDRRTIEKRYHRGWSEQDLFRPAKERKKKEKT